MNNLFLIFTFLINLNFSTINQKEGLTFESKTIDFGLVQFNSNGNRKFVYTNNNKKSIFITKSITSCGCVNVSYNENEIKKGEKGIIEVYYDTQRLGRFIKTITLTTSESEEVVLTIKGEVVNND